MSTVLRRRSHDDSSPIAAADESGLTRYRAGQVATALAAFDLHLRSRPARRGPAVGLEGACPSFRTPGLIGVRFVLFPLAAATIGLPRARARPAQRCSRKSTPRDNSVTCSFLLASLKPM